MGKNQFWVTTINLYTFCFFVWYLVKAATEYILHISFKYKNIYIYISSLLEQKLKAIQMPHKAYNTNKKVHNTALAFAFLGRHRKTVHNKNLFLKQVVSIIYQTDIEDSMFAKL